MHSATRISTWVLALAIFVGAGSALAQSPRPTPVIVELFTSEGCSSCPPADALLIELDQKQPIAGAEVVALGHHVDYWDALGWRDRFSSHDGTERQGRYSDQFHLDSVYTPQMVVDGRFQMVGNDRAEVGRAIANAARSAKPLTVTLEPASGDAVRVAVEGAPSRSADVMLAITESDLSTSVGGGENRGRQLRHTAVVRRLERIGSTAEGRFSSNVVIPYRPEWDRQHLRAVVFVQQRGTGPILGAAATSLSSPSSAAR